MIRNFQHSVKQTVLPVSLLALCCACDTPPSYSAEPTIVPEEITTQQADQSLQPASRSVERDEQATASCLSALSDDWMIASAQRILSYNELLQFASERFGAPSVCSGKIGTSFDSQTFGTIRFTWRDGVHFSVTTLPPESMINYLSFKDASIDEGELMEFLKSYTERLGYSIDWGRPVEGYREPMQTRSYLSNLAGDNARLQFEYNSQKQLIGVKFSSAL